MLRYKAELLTISGVASRSPGTDVSAALTVSGSVHDIGAKWAKQTEMAAKGKSLQRRVNWVEN